MKKVHTHELALCQDTTAAPGFSSMQAGIGVDGLVRYVGGQLDAYAYRAGKPAPRAAETTHRERITIADPSTPLSITRDGYVKRAPRLYDQVMDRTRTTQFTHADGRTVSERTGLLELSIVLNKNAQEIGETRIDTTDGRPPNAASSMLKNLTFIGEPEFNEAAAGIADYWKRYLSKGAERKLCLLPGLGLDNSVQKSDKHVLDMVMGHFDEEELDYLGRSIITDKEKLKSDPRSTKVIILDDWTISGSQLQSGYNRLNESNDLEEYAKEIEVNVLAASRVRLELGLGKFFRERKIPVKTYWLAHDAEGYSEYPVNDAFITGLHSSVDYDFENLLKNMPIRSQGVPMIADVKSAYKARDLTNLHRLRAVQAETASTGT